MRRGHVARALVVMIDGDNRGVSGRLARLDEACTAVGVAPRKAEERVAVAVPTWNIEAWIAYLAGTAVDETRRDYPALDRARECGPHVNALLEMCSSNALRQPAPPSLEAACVEYRTRLA